MSSATPSISVVIPTYNGQRFLGLVLAALGRQSAEAESFEVVLIDNNSTVDLFAGAGTLNALAVLRDRGVEFRSVRETRQGLTFARAAGVRAARAPVVCFLDDDNEPVADYVRVGLDAFKDPQVGLLTLRVFPCYEKQPSPAVRRWEHLFALNYKLGEAPIRWAACCTICPALGAGLWVRKSAFEAIQQTLGEGVLPDRVASRLVSGGDIELGIGVGKIGYDRLYVPQLIIRHHIPAERVEPGYVVRIIDGIVRSEAALHRRYLGEGRKLLGCAAGLVARIALGWVVAAARGDFFREYRFLIATAISRLRGPIQHDSLEVGRHDPQRT